ncbi:S9 family peptidase [Pseudonocardia charpentierae]|uniref:Prolyl oligopeptidase family serine peptidase n=1 Tax=Pseudonocardia charpentierae TaxID=3075545 RepID=A0ABU2NH44_9PSEU|nr:prolyl oligopeptidase family serine peptidase [Pseudonocardia sp. DSM 45834]MDT0353267.1 prolyl oligopeptidase family serine peptidase [Pseudonocardia sp. DSM 45834]
MIDLRAREPDAVTAPFGSWTTPVTSEVVVGAAVRLGEVVVDGGDVVWAESRPSEGGRTQLVRRRPYGTTDELLPEGRNARTAVHEYGGAAWWVRDGVLWFTDWADQRLYHLEPEGTPEPLTPEPARPRGDRYADGELSADGTRIVCVRERHLGDRAIDVVNEVVVLDARVPGEPEVLVSGPDFVAAPRVSPDGTTLAWLQWNHPAMPWDAAELVVRDLASGEETVVAGGPVESVTEPRWRPDGSLWFLSDRTDWWNLYRWQFGHDIEAVVRTDADIGVPAWVFGTSRYAVLDDGRVVVARWRDGFDGLAVRGLDGILTDLDLPFTAVGSVVAAGPDAVVVVAGSPVAEPGVHRIDLSGAPPRVETLRAPRDLGLGTDQISVPEAVRFPSVDGAGESRTGRALFYPPVNPRFQGPEGERPPLLVVIHGGPTSKASPVLAVGVQYWTSRGFAVVDVDYGGSSGYGRPYRELLRGQWGVVDVADCLAAARALADRGRADPGRLCIRGGSAGGYTTLAALARADTPFAAGADHFGVADLEALARDTHKFESRYLDGLVGPYPEARDVYVERSPITHVERFTRPLIVLQGAEDAIVPPAQSEAIVGALRGTGVPVAYLLFEGEQHGFRRAENVRRALDAELSFYAQVLGFPLDEAITPVEVENL